MRTGSAVCSPKYIGKILDISEAKKDRGRTLYETMPPMNVWKTVVPRRVEYERIWVSVEMVIVLTGLSLGFKS